MVCTCFISTPIESLLCFAAIHYQGSFSTLFVYPKHMLGRAPHIHQQSQGETSEIEMY